LYGVINTTKTAMGSRLLYEYLAHPINDEGQLTLRLDHIDYYIREQ
jgi:DNA mismatch repair ATPase MutS